MINIGAQMKALLDERNIMLAKLDGCHVMTIREAAIKNNLSIQYVKDLIYARRIKGAHKIGNIWIIPSYWKWTRTKHKGKQTIVEPTKGGFRKEETHG